jgi:SNF2 family DNA or RNA helicase
MARAKVDDKQLEIEKPKFSIDAYDEKSFCIIPDDYADTIQHSLYQGFAEVKWRRVDGTGVWVIPVTKPNVEYLRRTWRKAEYTISETANILLTYEELSAKVDTAKAKRRWEYIFNGTETKFTYPAKRKPFAHQNVAVEAAYGAEYFAHLAEMGCGKSKMVCDEVLNYVVRLEEKQLLKVVIVCPKSLMINWAREIRQNIPDDLFYMSIVQLKGELSSIDSVMEAFTEPTRVKFFIVSYDSVGAMLPQLQMIKPTMLVCDESHYIKNSESKRWKAVRKLADVCAMRRILTGTPVANTILDVWSQFEILRPGALGYNTFTGFKKAYCKIESNGPFEKITGYKDVDKLKENMARMSFIVRKDQCLDLPDKLYDVHYVDMPPAMADIYQKFATEFSVMLDDGREISTEFIIVQMLRLSQICCGVVGATERIALEADGLEKQLTFAEEIGEGQEEKFRSVLTTIPGADLKMNEMLEDVEEVVKEGSKVILWSRFRHDNRVIHKKLNDMGIWNGIYDGGTNDKDRQAIVDAFNNDDDFKVFIGNTGSGGVGLTLLGTKNCPCHTSMFYSNDFSYGKREQAEARNHRIGQVNKVLYRDYVYRGTIEEYICKKLQQKKDLSESVKNVGELRDFLLNGARDE